MKLDQLSLDLEPGLRRGLGALKLLVAIAAVGWLLRSSRAETFGNVLQAMPGADLVIALLVLPLVFGPIEIATGRSFWSLYQERKRRAWISAALFGAFLASMGLILFVSASLFA